MSFPYLGYGIGLRTAHYSSIIESPPRVDWFEVISENFMGIKSGFGGRPLHILEQVRKNFPIAFHGVSMSIGSTSPLDMEYLARLKTLDDKFAPAWISDHLCWTGVGEVNLHDLLPLPFTQQALEHVVSRVTQVQEFLGRQILLENVSSYFEYQESEIPEWEFLSEISRRAGSGILLDINNIYVSALNHGFDPMHYLKGVARDRVFQFHLAGYTDKGTHLIDTHDHAVSDPVWALYREAVLQFGQVSTLLERDADIPELPVLLKELETARNIAEQALGEKRPSHG